MDGAFVEPKRPSGNCQVKCFLTDRTALFTLLVASNSKCKMGQIFVAFSEYLNFNVQLMLRFYFDFFSVQCLLSVQISIFFYYFLQFEYLFVITLSLISSFLLQVSFNQSSSRTEKKIDLEVAYSIYNDLKNTAFHQQPMGPNIF